MLRGFYPFDMNVWEHAPRASHFGKKYLLEYVLDLEWRMRSMLAYVVCFLGKRQERLILLPQAKAVLH